MNDGCIQIPLFDNSVKAKPDPSQAGFGWRRCQPKLTLHALATRLLMASLLPWPWSLTRSGAFFMQGALMKQGFFFGLLATLFVMNSAWAQMQIVDQGKQVQVGRYTTQGTVPPPELVNPLAVYAQLNFPRQTVQTVGQALDYALMRTGYRLVDPTALSEQARRFLGLPLPESQRQLGPFPVDAILTTLLGTAWHLLQDPITRQVWFELPASLSEMAPAEIAPEVAAAVEDKATIRPPHRWLAPANPEENLSVN
jgi:type IV pili sensor histidine kinase/response regulator